MNKLYFLTLFFLLCSSTLVTTWGVLPARQLAEYSQVPQEFTFTLRNPELQEGIFKVSFGGELKDYGVNKGHATLFFDPTVQEQDVTVLLKPLPSTLTPGRNSLRVILEQVPDRENTETVAVTTTLVAELVVNIPYDGVFVESILYTQASQANQPTPFEISLINKGDQAVNVYADMAVIGPSNNILATWRTDSLVLEYQGMNKIRTSWSGEKNPGSYTIRASVNYGGKTTVITKPFVVGSKEVRINSLSADTFRLGEINRILLQATNTWNEELENVYAEIFVVSKQGQVLQSFKSNSETFGPFQNNELVAYWDTAQLEVGTYTLNVISTVLGETFQYSFPALVSIDRLAVSTTTGQVTAPTTPADGSSTNSLLIILLLIVVISNVVIIIYFKNMKSNKRDK